MNTHIAVARFEDVCKTVCASRCVSALPSFSPHHIGSLAKESRQLYCRGVELKPISSPLRPTVACREQACPFRVLWFCQHSPVGLTQ